MIRIGKLTGKVYDENVDVSSIGECCSVVKNEELDAELSKWKISKILTNDCELCRGCPEYNKEP